MDKFIVTGGKKLSGSLRGSGSKNAALPLIAAALLPTKARPHLTNVPDLADIHTMNGVLAGLGAKINFNPSAATSKSTPPSSTATTRHTIWFARCGPHFWSWGRSLGGLSKARVSLPGGCVLGPRPVDQHVLGFKRLGAKITEKEGYVNATAKELIGARYFSTVPAIPAPKIS